MALELGGCDDPENIVPQYELWQGVAGGAWRDMEGALYSRGGDVMVVEIHYAVVGDNYVADQQLFNQNDRLIHWTGPNIPTRFQVWAVTASSGAGAGSIADYLAANSTDKELRIAGLMTAMQGVATFFDETINAMPAIDRNRWKLMMVNHWVRNAHAAYETAAQLTRQLALAAFAAAAGRLSARNQPALPAEPATLAVWGNTLAAQQAAVTAIRNNTAGASVNWTAGERLAFTTADVARAIFV